MKDAYYFTHDSNAKDDPKCVLLIEQLGCEGYGIFWILIETLREQPEYKYPMVLLPALARRFNTTLEKIKAVVTKYNFFEIENNEFFFSESLRKRMLKLESKRESNRIAGQISAANRKRKLLELSMKAVQDLTHVEHMLNTCSTNDEPLKYSKVKESKVEYNKEDIENIYKLYPSKCHSGRSTGKTSKNKDKIKSLFSKYKPDELKKIINLYIEDCRKNNTYLKNFATFLNNIPDIEQFEQKKIEFENYGFNGAGKKL